MTQIRQGETLSISGVFKDDNGVVIKDYTNRKMSVILTDSKQVVRDCWSNKTGASKTLEITPEGVLRFGIAGVDTREMLGDYYLEFKVTQDTVIIGKQLVHIQVLNSKIGREGTL